jgi:hypothetical protein
MNTGAAPASWNEAGRAGVCSATREEAGNDAAASIMQGNMNAMWSITHVFVRQKTLQGANCLTACKASSYSQNIMPRASRDGHNAILI